MLVQIRYPEMFQALEKRADLLHNDFQLNIYDAGVLCLRIKKKSIFIPLRKKQLQYVAICCKDQ